MKTEWSAALADPANYPQRMIPPNPLLKQRVAQEAAANLVVSPSPLISILNGLQCVISATLFQRPGRASCTGASVGMSARGSVDEPPFARGLGAERFLVVIPEMESSIIIETIALIVLALVGIMKNACNELTDITCIIMQSDQVDLRL
jgi:hypothetical protein